MGREKKYQEVSDIKAIMKRMQAQGENILVTRLSDSKAKRLKKFFPESTFHKRARALTLLNTPIKNIGKGTILVVCAGTSDLPVAEEAVITARFMGNIGLRV